MSVEDRFERISLVTLVTNGLVLDEKVEESPGGEVSLVFEFRGHGGVPG